jgi:CAAX protease family protein
LSSRDNPQFEPEPRNSEPQTPTPFVVEPFPPPASQPTTRAPKAGENPVWSGWDVLQIAGLTVLTLVVVQFVTIVVAHRYAYRRLSWSDVAQQPVLAIISEFLTYVGIAIFMVALVEGKYHVRFWQAIRWNWPRTEWRLLGIGVVTMAVLSTLERALPVPKSVPFDKFFETPMDAYLTSIFAVSFGPLMEELFFRGFLYPVLARRTGAIWGVILTAVPFGLVHSVQFGNAWSAVLVIFLVGIVLTVVRAVTKSVASSFLVHVGYNGMLMLLAALATDGFRHLEKMGLVLVRF